MTGKQRTFAMALLFFALVGARAKAADRFVCLAGQSVAPFTSWETAATNIQDAVDASSPGDRVWVTNGTYNLSDVLTLTNRVTVASINGAGVTTLDAQGNSRVVYISADSQVTGFRLLNGWDEAEGGGVYHEKGGTLFNCQVRNCTAYARNQAAGGGVYLHEGGEVINGLIHDNVSIARGTAFAHGKGGGAHGELGGTLQNCTIADNAVFGDYKAEGGGVYLWRGGRVTTPSCITTQGPAAATG